MRAGNHAAPWPVPAVTAPLTDPAACSIWPGLAAGAAGPAVKLAGSEAFHAPANPYPWRDESRVTLHPEAEAKPDYWTRQMDEDPSRN